MYIYVRFMKVKFFLFPLPTKSLSQVQTDKKSGIITVYMVLIFDGNSLCNVHVSEETKQICDCSRSTQMPSTDQITRHVRTILWFIPIETTFITKIRFLM